MGLQPGARFGRYEMVSRLGQGGMAETYRARLVGDAGVTKPVLIKKVLPEYANDDAFITMFVSEARISASLSHGNIAQVYDFGRVDGEYFLAMEFVDGQPLNRILKRALRAGMSSLPIPIGAFIGIEMCRGLHYAHTRTDQTGKPLGIVHRDISPDNVLISYEGQVKIVDFGIAKARELRGFNTEPGVVKGKYLFFSPEQARGKEVDARTDVWATGIVLYEMFCGQLPVRGPAYVAMPLLAEGKFPRPREINPELPQELDDIIMQALAVDPAQRLESCHELGDALAEFLYSAEPRFSSMSLSHFQHQLFREELAAEGRQVQVPRLFLEQMERWSLSLAPTNPARMAARTPTPPGMPVVRPAVKTQDLKVKPSQEDLVQPGMTEEKASAPMRKALYVGAGLVLTVLSVLVLVSLDDTQPVAAHELSTPKPIVPRSGALSSQKKEQPPPPKVELSNLEVPQEPRSSAPEEAAPPPAAAPEEEKPQREHARVALKDATKLLSAKKYLEAVEMARRCLEIDPVNADCHKLSGDAHSAVGHYEQAVRSYLAFIQLAPDDPRASQAERYLRARSIQIPSRTPPVVGREEQAATAQADATRLLKSKQYAAARSKARRCIELAPDNGECQLLIGIAYAHDNDWSLATPYYRKFLELTPDHKLAPKIRATMKALAGQDRVQARR
jgi:serine/threonine-protein kinase